MNFSEYQKRANATAIYDSKFSILYPTLGLAGEAGEVAEKVKKMLRDKARYSNEDLLNELGDVLFYTTALANIYGGTLKSIIELNMEKLDGRMERGTLRGSGDKR